MMDVWPFVLLSIPTMMVLGLRHGVDIDHITAIDNLVRLHNATKKSRWVGAAFRLGFDTATQISAISLSAVASVTAGVQVALSLAGFFALGMIPIDTLDSVLLRSALSKIFHTKGFRYMSYALSGVALLVATGESYGILMHTNVMPVWVGAVLAAGIILTTFAYGFITRKGGIHTVKI